MGPVLTRPIRWDLIARQLYQCTPGAGDVKREEIERSLHSDHPAWRRS
jgi:hypothetical protein